MRRARWPADRYVGRARSARATPAPLALQLQQRPAAPPGLGEGDGIAPPRSGRTRRRRSSTRRFTRSSSRAEDARVAQELVGARSPPRPRDPAAQHLQVDHHGVQRVLDLVGEVVGEALDEVELVRPRTAFASRPCISSARHSLRGVGGRRGCRKRRSLAPPLSRAAGSRNRSARPTRAGTAEAPPPRARRGHRERGWAAAGWKRASPTGLSPTGPSRRRRPGCGAPRGRSAGGGGGETCVATVSMVPVTASWRKRKANCSWSESRIAAAASPPAAPTARA